MNFPLVTFAFLSILCIEKLEGFDPCQGRSQIGGQCDYNRDCAGFGVICKAGKCDCHYNYQVKTGDDNVKYCAKLPDIIGAPCTGQCRFPMFCNNGKCECVRATKDGNRCYPDAKISGPCSQDAECTVPFSACIGGRCSCITGPSAGTTSGSTTQCVAPQHCPDGSKPSGQCMRASLDRSAIENRIIKDNSVDTCPADQYCYASDVSNGGFCCPIACPYSTTPNTAFSCAPNATSANACPLDTHFCHRLAGQSFSVTACCRRPCREPTPLFVNGKCYARAWLGGPCTISEQCDGGETMQCNNGLCNCKSGFSPQSGSFITSENPPQTCVRSCGSQASRSGDCFAGASLGSQCDVDDQCPSNAKCFRGTCICNCDGGYIKSGSSCVKIQTTTVSSGRGVTNGKGGGIIDILGGLVKPASGGQGGGLLG